MLLHLKSFLAVASKVKADQKTQNYILYFMKTVEVLIKKLGEDIKDQWSLDKIGLNYTFLSNSNRKRKLFKSLCGFFDVLLDFQFWNWGNVADKLEDLHNYKGI